MLWALLPASVYSLVMAWKKSKNSAVAEQKFHFTGQPPVKSYRHDGGDYCYSFFKPLNSYQNVLIIVCKLDLSRKYMSWSVSVINRAPCKLRIISVLQTVFFCLFFKLVT